MDAMKAEAKDRGHVETLFGRRIHLPGIKDKNAAVRQFAERQAINAPIQGAAADIMRRAMIRIHKSMTTVGLKSRMLLQVHDELVFEAPENEADTLIEMVKDVMSNAALPAQAISVPLDVDANAAATWGQAH
jgi:DNA polymerase-1